MERAGGGRRVGLCVLCGLPAAGKSTLARALRRLLPCRQGWDCALLTYDELIPQEAFGRGEPAAGQPPLVPCWKRRRRELLRHLERLLRALAAEQPLAAAEQPLAAPAAAPPAWAGFVRCCAEQGLLSEAESGAGASLGVASVAAARPLYLILDDNFYYRSMRYEVYQLARTHSLSFCQLFLECPLEQCLQRNRLRSHPLPDETICLMAGKIEMPDLEKNTWEQNSLILKSFECTSEDEYDAVLMKGFHAQIINLLATALENPVKQNEDNTEQKEADRVTCAASTVHQADQTCRRIISQTMKEAKDKNVLPSEMKNLAEELSKLKAQFLEDLRQGSHLKNSGQQNHSFDPAISVLSSFQLEATNVVNKYILK